MRHQRGGGKLDNSDDSSCLGNAKGARRRKWSRVSPKEKHKGVKRKKWLWQVNFVFGAEHFFFFFFYKNTTSMVVFMCKQLIYPDPEPCLWSPGSDSSSSDSTSDDAEDLTDEGLEAVLGGWATKAAVSLLFFVLINIIASQLWLLLYFFGWYCQSSLFLSCVESDRWITEVCFRCKRELQYSEARGLKEVRWQLHSTGEIMWYWTITLLQTCKVPPVTMKTLLQALQLREKPYKQVPVADS